MLLSTHLPALQVLVPLLAALVCFLAGRGAWHIATFSSGLAFTISLALCADTLSQNTLIYRFGGWPSPIGIEYHVDTVSALIALIISGASIATLLYARHSLTQELSSRAQPYFYTLFCLCSAGLLGVVTTGDLFNAFVFLEIASLASYGLVAMGGINDRRAYSSAFNYLIMGSVGATFFVIGIGFLYQSTGTLNMLDMAMRLRTVPEIAAIDMGLAFIVSGLLLKAAAFPLHMWLPGAYAYAPSATTIFLAASSSKASLYFLINILFSIFGKEFIYQHLFFDTLILPLALGGVIFASIAALQQNDLKHLLAYSSIAQIGYILIGFGIHNLDGLQAAFLHTFNHALMKSALFMAAGCMLFATGCRITIQEMNGLGRRMPWTAGFFTLAAISLAGLPPTAGFISKWQLVSAAAHAGSIGLAFLILLSSVITLVYVGRLVDALYFKPPQHKKPLRPLPFLMMAPLACLALANLYFGLDPSFILKISGDAADILFTSPPPSMTTP